MQFRCVKCKKIFRTEFVRARTASSLVCTHCGARYSQLGNREALTDPEQHGASVQVFARASNIGLPEANAVLLGMMKLEQAREFSGDTPRRKPPHASFASESRPAQADPPKASAKKTDDPSPRNPIIICNDADVEATQRSRRNALVMILILLAISTAVGSYGLRSWGRQAEVTARVARRAQPKPEPAVVQASQEIVSGPAIAVKLARVQRDQVGEVVRVSSTTPLVVLAKFCETFDPPGACQPLEIVSTRPERVNLRFGIFRDISRDSKTFAIRIHLDSETRRWIAANLGKPIVPFPIDPAQFDGRRIDARTRTD